MINSPRYILILIVVTLLTIGCYPIVRPEQLSHNEYLNLSRDNSVGQTFFGRFRGLSGVEVFIKPRGIKDGELILTLFNNPQRELMLAKSNLSLKRITQPNFYLFTFPPQSDSTNHDYYLEITTGVESPVEIGVGSGESYLDGAVYQNNEPQDSQLAFRLAYEPYQVAIGLILLGFSWLAILCVAIFLYILPGWGVLSYLETEWKVRSWGEKIGLSAGVSLAIYPILFLWTDLVGLHLGRIYAWLPPLLGIGIILWRNRGWRPGHLRLENTGLSIKWLRAIDYADFALILLLGLVLATRFWVIRNLEIPLWGDSYQHTMIAQLLVDNKGLFDSWEPYADLQTFTYHFGFHTLVAIFHWITKIPMPKATLWTGQIINLLAIASLYPLAVKVGKNRWAGVFAVLLAGLLSPMPMYYVNWGRFTQLAGQVVLPAAVLVLWEVLENRSLNWRAIGLSWILMGGLAITHYRILIFGILATIPIILFNFRSWISDHFRIFKHLFLFGAGAFILFFPWFIHVFKGKIVQIFFNQITASPSNLSTFTQEYNAIGDLSTYLPPFMWLILPIVLGWSLWRREKYLTVIAIWWFFILVTANPHWLNLPGAGSITNFAVFIAAYLPVAIILGSAISWLTTELLICKSRKLVGRSGALFVFIVGAGLWGSTLRIRDINISDHILVTRPDLRASRWIEQNLAEDANFLVNSFFAYGNTLIVGSDGGWWLPLLTQRSTNLPPLTYGSEQGPIPNYRQRINKIIKDIQDDGLTNPSIVKMLEKRGITHIYIGQQQGYVNNDKPILKPNEIHNPPFKILYQHDRVWIFELKDTEE